MTEKEIKKFNESFNKNFDIKNCSIDDIIGEINNMINEQKTSINTLAKKLNQENFQKHLLNIELKVKDYHIKELLTSYNMQMQ